MKNRKRKNKFSISGMPKESYLSTDYDEAEVTTSNFKLHFLISTKPYPTKQWISCSEEALVSQTKSKDSKHNHTLRGS